jgi:hypothetical protein
MSLYLTTISLRAALPDENELIRMGSQAAIV